MELATVKVLVVEDDPLFVDDLRVLLPSWVELDWSRTSSEAITALESGARPHAIILDWCLPPELADSDKSEGLALLRKIRSQLGSSIPVCVLTSLPRTEVGQLSLENGADAFFHKAESLKPLIEFLEHRGQD